ncbi:daptide-type RiPP biosynthesis aminotransferase [Rathayibacter iranicus]|uniref:Aspartate aminotransferase family protein n=2 Tax=Rathayibacter iranicus TaxID=59737 RepID=A0AAD1ENY2_9MICO|nr:daptide-type RiPP biosynthesis aminotransferase [Rathayibacter iranicus]AZZ57240.1 aspartate aminotransferase family protein [Rathayibacter iranicus]MWV29900.1 aminotransferase class III-fold pyridoxal phosphate-dependent enzyme [Rathayibacter iranicus NCPPB 2253 = VKM Ac-1602]PPI51695.1 aspartate aminotransferase family protein [Rathayibacter iranicus]PPI63865.1 aspartate aminotransferase family protein [Rathayibacter iranicus]PPI74710.1 aspartate aminotransferase family protein [Rathayiba
MRTGGAWTSLVPASRSTSVLDSQMAVGAHGVHVEMADGRKLLCATSGLWNVPLGYGNSAIADAITESLHRASYLTLFRSMHSYAADAATALLDFVGDGFDRVIFSTSGGSANDAVMKLARHFWVLRSDAQRRIVVGLLGSYHGTTYGSHALSGDDLHQTTYGVDRRSIRHVPYDDDGEKLAALMAREGHRVAAIVLEPVLGSGAVELPAAFLSEVLRLKERYGFLLVADEVATGFYRAGQKFASQDWAISPDILILSKALTNGTCAASAVLIAPSVSAEFGEQGATFVHGETQAGSPASCAAIVATLAEMSRLDIAGKSAHLAIKLNGVVERLAAFSFVDRVTGRGCMRGIYLKSKRGHLLSPTQVASIVDSVREAGVIVQPGPSCIQLLPPLVLERNHLEELEIALREGLRRIDRRVDFDG